MSQETSEEEILFKESLLYRSLDFWTHPSQSLAYCATLPPSFVQEQDTTIQDYEPHCYGIGSYAGTDEESFSMFSSELSWRCPNKIAEQDQCSKIRICNCQDILRLVQMEPAEREHLWGDVLVSLPPQPEVETTPESAAEIEQQSVEEVDAAQAERERLAKQARILEESMQLVVDCEHWEVCEEHGGRCLSAVFVSLCLLFPKLTALKIRKLRCWSTGSDLFAAFPAPQNLIAMHPPCRFTVSPLQTLAFYHSNLSSADVCYLADCCTEHKVFPNLRNIQFYYCSGMSYTSITSCLSSVANVDFDRWECSGWCWPLEPYNPKNSHVHM